MQIEYFGHSCFRLTTDSGIQILTDPYTAVGYEMPKGIHADIVTVSHEHFDHNHIAGVLGAFSVVRGTGATDCLGVKFEGISTFHDAACGALRGKNTVYKITADDMTICHLGDIGEPCNEALVQSLGKVDVLLVPVGGTYTIDEKGAWEYVRAIAPSTVIPMHYLPSDGRLDIADEQAFLDGISYLTCSEAYIPKRENNLQVVFMRRKECV